MAETAPLVLVDGSSYLFRAFHALPQLMSSKGHPTGAVKGVVAMIKKLLEDYPGSHVAVVFDARGKSFRNDLYAEYKANRASMPDDLRQQIEPIHEIIRMLGIPLLVVDGVEADDVIGTLAAEAEESGVSVVISTGDKDMAQLVGPHVSLINTMTDTAMDEAGVVDKFGVRPDQIIDYLALVGDTSDNIPGVPKCGPKTAVKWLAEYETLDGVMASADKIKGKIGENLRASLPHLPLSRQLATIKLDVELPASIAELTPGEPDTEGLLRLYTEFEFKSWVDELVKDVGGQDAAPQATEAVYETILDETQLAAWVERLAAAPRFAVDTETTSLAYMQAELVGLSFSCAPGEAAYVPFGHVGENVPAQLGREQVLDALRPLLEDPDKPKVAQHGKYDMSVLERHGVSLKGLSDDTMLESYVLNSVASRHNMDDLALKYLGITTTSFEDIAGKGAKQLTFDKIDLGVAGPYAAEDADITLRLHEVLSARLAAEPELASVYRDIEMPLVPLLSRIERTGVLIDADLLRQMSDRFADRMETLTAQAYELAGGEFNLASTKQLQEIFFERLQLPVIKKTPKGQPSTAEPVLQELAHDYELPRVIMEYRGLSKLKSTYTDHLPREVNAETGRVHTSYHQAVAATGRLSSADPNLQNIPIRTEDGRAIRKAFIAPPGQLLVAADYSQIELRIMAHLSEDTGLLTAFRQGLDIHRATAAEVFGEAIDEVKDYQRRSAKAINFGLIYGMSAFGLARQLGIPRGDAQDYIDRYFERYPGVLEYMENTREFARDRGYVETLFGRRLYLPDIRASNFNRRQGAERQAINAPMQGTAADIIKRAMLAVDDWLTREHPDTRMIMQVHDELVLEVPAGKAETVASEVSQRMMGAAELAIPLVVEAGIGANWDDAH